MSCACLLFSVCNPVHAPEGRPGMSGVTLLSGISGLSFDSPFLLPCFALYSPCSFCLVIFLLMVLSPYFFFFLFFFLSGKLYTAPADRRSKQKYDNPAPSWEQARLGFCCFSQLLCVKEPLLKSPFKYMYASYAWCTIGNWQKQVVTDWYFGVCAIGNW